MTGDVDTSVLDRMDEVLGSPSETKDLLAEFLRSADAWCAAIASQEEGGSGTDGHRAAHTLASSAAMVGASALARCARELETAFAHGPVPPLATRTSATTLLAELRAAWARAERLP